MINITLFFLTISLTSAILPHQSWILNAVSLLFAYVFGAIIMLNLGAQYVAILYLLVYVGAVVVLMIFVFHHLDTFQTRSGSFAVVLLVAFLATLTFIFTDTFGVSVEPSLARNSVSVLASAFFVNSIPVLLAVAAVILVAITGALAFLLSVHNDKNLQD